VSHLAIPTHYNGVNFRSRLEAKWAAFFDKCRWPWEYEPLDLGGRIPDFVLQLPRPVMIECKPASTDDELRPHRDSLLELAHDWMRVGVESDPRYRALTEKLAALDALPDTPWFATGAGTLCEIDDLISRMEAFTTRDVVVVGTQPRLSGNFVMLGDLAIAVCPCCRQVTPSRMSLLVDGSYSLECAWCYAESGILEPRDVSIPASEVLGAWRDACNATQWRSVEPR
jgi:hypothetical protein